MTAVAHQAALSLATDMARIPDEARAEYLHEVITHAAGGLALIQGRTAIAERLYQLADALAAGAPT